MAEPPPPPFASPPPPAKPTVYIETTVVSLLTARPSRDVVGMAHQMITRDWWTLDRPKFDLYTSDFTLAEAAAGDPSASAERLEALRDIPLLEVATPVTALSEQLALALALPPRARIDAAHVAVAAVNGMEFLLTWNCRHLANLALADKIERACEAAGFVAPRIVTPEQLRAEP